MSEPPVPPPVTEPTDSSPPEPLPAAVPALPITLGTGLAFLGSGLAALSTAFAWAASLAPASFGPQGGYLASSIPLPALVDQRSTALAPSLGLVVLVLSLLTAALVVLSAAGRWSDIVRRVLGVVIVLLVALFVWRYHEPAGAAGVGFLSALRAGAYLALVGGLLIAIFGPPIERSEPRGLDVLPEDLP